MQNLPPNSHKARETEPREKIDPVTSAETIRRKRGLGRQFKETFFSGSGRDAASHVVDDVVVPTIRDMIHDALSAGIDRLIYGERNRPRHSRGYSPPWHQQTHGNVDYAGLSSGNNKASSERTLSRKSRHDFDDIIIPSMQEANTVLDRMYDIMSQYGRVSLSDLYALVGIRPDHTDMKWGWFNLRGARAVHVKKLGGYLLDLPEPEELGR